MLFKRLTEREKEVLSLIAQGYTNEEISKKFFISWTTVKTHINCIYGKLVLYRESHKEISVMRLRAALIYLQETGVIKDKILDYEQF